MLPREIVRQVRRIEIRTNRIVNDMLVGRYESVFKGHGMEFDEVREYQPGDDIRLIDWNVTARTGCPHIKRFVEERELTVMLLVDLSASMSFGTVGQLKQHLATELSAVLAFSAIKNHDKVGAILFTDHVEHFIPPKKGPKHVLRLIREVLRVQPTGHGTRIDRALEHLNRIVKRRAVIFLISDMIGTDMEQALTIANRRHDVIAIHLVDPREESLPSLGWLQLADAETGAEMMVNTGSRDAQEGFHAWSAEYQQDVRRLTRAAAVDLVNVRTDQPYMEPLLKFFRLRSTRY
jgi:uncharacterized protein (DUF58 family)